MKKNYAIRKSDRKKLEVVNKQGDEICIIEKFLFWTPLGNKMQPIEIWQPMSRFEIAE